MDPSRKSPAPPEKESYSYDEMMARLRSQRSSGGRRIRIEGEDGMVEIKKRKRRTHQPAKQRKQRLGKLKKRLLLICIPAVLLLIGLYMLLQARYESEGFRNGLSERASELLGAPTEISTLNVSGLSIRSRKMFVEPPGSFLREAEFASLSGNLTAGSLFSSDWHLTSAAALHARLRFQTPGAMPDALAAGAPPSGLVTAGLGLSSRPGAIKIDKLLINSANFVWAGRKDFVFLEEATLVSKGGVGRNTAFRLTDATLRVPAWPEFQVERAELILGPAKLQVRGGVMTHNYIGHKGGDATLNGQIDLSDRSAKANFICEFDSMPIESLARKEWKPRVDGDVDATLNFQADLAVPGSLEVSGPFWIRNGSYGDIIPTKRLAAFLAEPRISRIPFHSIKGKITLRQDKTVVEDIEATAPDFVQVKGAYAIEPDGILSGELEVAISDKVLTKLPGGKPDFFISSTTAPGFSVASVKVSGTTTQPIEDLTPRLEAALEKYKIESAAPPASAYPTIPLAPGAKKNSKDPETLRKKKAEESFEKILEP